MTIPDSKITYTGEIKEIKLGKEGQDVVVGGESAYSFHLFEGKMPHAPKIALEVVDSEIPDCADAIKEVLGDVLNDPVAWAKKVVAEQKPDMVCLTLLSTDPNGLDRAPEEAAKVVKDVAAAIDVPLIVWGSTNEPKDADVLRAVAEACQGERLVIGPVQEGNYKQIGAAALAYDHTVIASTPIDINLAKQLNILLENLGVPLEKIVIDPTVGGLGYGFEYTYSVMERLRMAALTQKDEKLQIPMICQVAREVWKVKEAKLSESEAPTLGDAKKRGVLMEAMTAQGLLLAGADIVILRHPESAQLVRDFIGEMTTA
jgi:CO dehydrogenase/acetyl-CoA synthase delta subunit